MKAIIVLHQGKKRPRPNLPPTDIAQTRTLPAQRLPARARGLALAPR